MNALKFFVVFAFVIACGLAVQAAETESKEVPAGVSDNARQKRYPYAYGYSAYHAPYYSSYHAPYAYHAPLASYSYPYVAHSYYGYHAPHYY